MFAAISGLKNHQTFMDVVGNNIANVNTTGFKQSRVTFQDILSQLINFVEQWIEKKIEMWLMDKFISEGTQAAAEDNCSLDLTGIL